MNSTTDKIKGLANEAAGNVKQAVGKATGSDKLEAEGRVQELKGEAQQAKGKAKDAVKNVIDKA
ncbi:CsbD family protein [Pseudochrobactrum sp. MP213Fo]|uniref:CsbD family protein n=1 Tax=Pseudochrobactrum sp. MP213Fo TaxID=3022250 RepID=UPI003BA1684C